MTTNTYSLKKISVPFATPFYEKLREGVKIIIHGIVRAKKEGDFEVELLAGGNIALHLQFNFSPEGNNLVLNSLQENNWGVEKKAKNPLHDNVDFHMTIHVSTKQFNIELMGKPLAELKHRMPFETVQALGIKGDVELKSVQFQGFPMVAAWDENAKHAYEGYGTSTYTPPVGATIMKLTQLAMIMDKESAGSFQRSLLQQQMAAHPTDELAPKHDRL